jgi:ApbE superfamily uncharacterized protein (UPF0280 family)
MPKEAGRKDIYRTYRRSRPGLHCFRVAVGETDLWIEASWDCRKEVERLVKYYRRQVKNYIHLHPDFLTTLEPWADDPEAPEVVTRMITASRQAGVGPMAAVAGAINYCVGLALLNGEGPKEAGEKGTVNKESFQRELLIENGGDLFLSGSRQRIVGIHAGESPFSWRIGVQIDPESYRHNGHSYMGICTSAGRVGHSLSMGQADAAVILSTDPVLADAVATATANRIQTPRDLKSAIEFATSIPQVTGVLLVCGEKLAVWGDLQVVNLAEEIKEGEEE